MNLDLLTSSLPLSRALALRSAQSVSLASRRLGSSTANPPPTNRRGRRSSGSTLRTNLHFTLKEPSGARQTGGNASPQGQRGGADQNPLKRADLDEFVACYSARDRTKRTESERWKSFTYEELTKRDKVNLDLFWLKDDSLEDSANLPDPGVLALEITEDLEAALAQFAEIATDLKK